MGNLIFHPSQKKFYISSDNPIDLSNSMQYKTECSKRKVHDVIENLKLQKLNCKRDDEINPKK